MASCSSPANAALSRPSTTSLSKHVPPEKPLATDQVDRLQLSLCYGIVSERRRHYEALLWQVPVLSLTGQAFLFTIALAPTSSLVARVLSMALSILVSYLTGGTFAKHSITERADVIWLHRAEGLLFTSTELFGSKFEWCPNGTAHIDEAWEDGRHDIWRAAVLRRSAYDNNWMVRNWIWGIRTIGICAALILLLAVTKPSVLGVCAGH